MTKRTLLIFVIVVFTQLMFGVIVQSYTFFEPTVKVEGDFSKIVMDNSFLNGVAAQPEIPYKGVMLYLPTSEEITSVNVKRGNAQEIKLDKPLFPVQQQYPLSLLEQAKFTEPDSDIYNSAKPFPADKSKNIRTDFMAGHSVGSFAVALVDYYPQENRLVWYAEITIEVETGITEAGEEAQLLRKDTESVVARLSRSVDNPEMVPMPTDERSVGVNYLIIYPEAYLTQIEEIKQYHNIRNRTVKLLSMEYIQANEVPNGASYRDLQEKIREYIKYYYSQPANDIQYVLLAGDDDVIPHRGFYSNNDVQEDYDIPADCYYSNLDRDFDANGNGVFGEQMDADLMPELAIGRVCYNNAEELDNIIHKLHKFSEEPVLGSIKSSLMVGEYLWEGPTWGGDHMDELIGFTNIHGYQTDGFPEDWAYSKVYDRDYGYSDAWSNVQLYPHLSQGPTYVNHLGHSFTNYNMRLSNRHVTPQNISNNGVTANYSVHFTQGCYAGSFDNRGTNPGSYGDDCITEKFTAISTSAVAMISHSRYGWGVQGSTNGASQKYHRQWANAIFTEEIDAIGETLNACKIANIPSMDSPTMYWIYYQTNLFGDPAMMLWRDEPNIIEENIVTTWNLGQPSYPLDITTESATAALLNSENELLWRGEKDILGNINVNTTTTLLAGEYTLVLNAPQCLPKVLTITIEQDDTPFIAIHNIEEVNSNNNLFGATDVISFNLTAQNHSSFDLNEDAYVKLISLNEFVEVTQDSLYIGHLLGNEAIDQHGVFEIRNLGGHEDLEEALLRFTTYFGTQQSVTQKQITLNASNVSLGSVAVVGSALSPEAGAQNALNLTFENNGSGFARGIELIFYSYYNGITITPNSYSIPEIEPHQTITIEDVFSLNITTNVEDYSPGNMVVTIVDPYYDVNEYFYDFLVGLNEYSFETGDDGFISEQPNDDYTNQWHRSDNQNNTPNGRYSFKFGGTGAGHYTNHAYGYLITPEFHIVSGSVFKFSHKMNAENDNQDEFAAWDGGYVEMSVNGGDYNIIEPVGGYPYYMNNNPANLIPGSTPVYSGIIQWSQAEFNLGTVSGNVRFRFVFGSDALTVREGWYVDDIFVEQPSTDNIFNEVELTQVKIKGNYPNPFNPETTIEYLVPYNESKSLQLVNIEIYNLKGQKVKTLLNENKSPGNYRVTWKGVNDDSQPVSSGIYFTKIKVGNVTDLHKMVLMK